MCLPRLDAIQLERRGRLRAQGNVVQEEKGEVTNRFKEHFGGTYGGIQAQIRCVHHYTCGGTQYSGPNMVSELRDNFSIQDQIWCVSRGGYGYLVHGFWIYHGF